MNKPVLISVDDDPSVLTAVQQDLRTQYGEDYRVLGADTGAGGLELVEGLRRRGDAVALFLADQRMPGMTGVEFLEHASKLYPEAKRTLLTAYADTDVAIAAINTVKLDHYLMKPWDPPEERLYPTISDLLDDWRAGFRPPFEGIRVVCDRWSPQSHAAKDFLARNQIPFVWVDTENDAEATNLIASAAIEDPRFPLLVFPDGVALAAPSNREIAERIGLQTQAEQPFYDLIVVGGGPAGLSAGVYGAAAGLRTLIVEREAPGGQAGMSARIENYLGFPVGLSGGDLARRAVSQARRLGAEILSTSDVVRLTAADSYRGVELADGSELRCYAVLMATGVEYRKLEQPGIAELTGSGVYYGAAMIEGQSIKGEDVFIAGGANSAGQAALYFAQFANSVTVLVRGNSLTKSMANYLVERIQSSDNIRVMLNTEIVEASGTRNLETLTLTHNDTGQTEAVAANALFIFVGAKPATAWAGNLVARDEHGFVLSGPDLKNVESGWPLLREPFLLETSLPGVFVGGDVRHGNTKRVVSAVNEGAMAVNFVQERLKELGV
jgi:thioredoxin reductase (NADPH)